MNPIPLNDRGQYRYTDLVGYIPDFLKEEPDVVELLQIFSDYMNNAYRNIESVQKFDFKLCTSESTVGKAKRKLNSLRDMMEEAEGQGARVAILSVPRSNVKSNSVFTRANYPYTLSVDLESIPDTIANADEYDSNLVYKNDGDVVYVTFTSVSGSPTVSYYLSVSTDGEYSLNMDSMGSSQDPFTDTRNDIGRIVTFSVSDVSAVHTRYGTSFNGCKYYEVFFTATISDVKSDSSFTHCDVGSDKLAVDYYGLHSVAGTTLGVNQYYSTVGFSDSDSWEWKSGYPTAIIYMIGGSAADIVDGEYTGMGTVADPVENPSVSRIGVTVTMSGGQAIATSVSMIPVSDNMVFTAMSESGENLGRFSATCVDGNPRQLRLVPYDDTGNASALAARGRIILTYNALYYSRKIGDSSGYPSIAMKRLDSLDSVSGIIRIYSCEALGVDNVNAGSGRISLMAGRHLHVSGDACAYLSPTLAPKYLYCENAMWNGVLEVSSISADDTGYVIEYNTIDRSGITDTAATCNIYVIRSGIVTVDSTHSADTSRVFLDSVAGTMCVFYPVGEGDTYVKTMKTGDSGISFDCSDVPAGDYLVTGVDIDGHIGVINTVDHVTYNSSSQSYTYVVSRYSGDVYGGKYYVIITDDNKKHVLSNANGIDVFSSSASYSVGDVVSYGGSVYMCRQAVQAGEGVPGYTDSFTDVTSKYQYYGRSYSTNKYMPFYGQICTLGYDESIGYSGIGEPSIFTLPLYICKAEDIRLKYGWEHREYIKYPQNVNLDTKTRNGYMELYDSSCSMHSSDCFINKHNAVTSTPANSVCWNVDYEVIKRGCEHFTVIAVDNVGTVGAYRDGDYWVVTIRSSDHGLHDGCEISVSNFPSEPIDINVGYVKVDVLDGDTFTYKIPAASSDTSLGSEVTISIPDDIDVRYVGDYRYTVTGVPSYDEENKTYTIPLAEKAIGLHNGDGVILEYMFAGYDHVSAVVSDDSEYGNAALTVKLVGVSGLTVSVSESSRVRGSISENDIVDVSGTLYRVSQGDWSMVGDNDIVVPMTLFAKDNLFEVKSNNPAIAVGDRKTIQSIKMVSGSTNEATVIASGLEHFYENTGAVENHTMVYIENVYPSEYGGWHLVTKVNSEKSFNIRMNLLNSLSTKAAASSNDATMTVREGRWYKYTINSVGWNKVSNRATYYGSNVVTLVSGSTVTTKQAHGFKAGDRIIGALPDEFSKYDCNNDVSFYQGIVDAVISDTKFTATAVDGELSEGMGVCRGIVLTGGLNCIETRFGEYTNPVFSEDNSTIAYTYRFMENDVVVAKAQYNENEQMAYVVRKGANWIPMRAKRAMKVTEIDAEQYQTQDPTEYYDPDEMSEYTYQTYSDVDVAAFEGNYIVSGMYRAANVNFSAPALSDMDTTQPAATEYSSGEDYSNVAPRTGMDSSFAGIPDMKYPLAERIERLCYLRDPNVIDYDLIGYLARFMGYDVTQVSDDITESPVYGVKRDRERAVRAAIASLPQYYSLGGTNAGIGMLMDTFGVIGKVIPLWTRTEKPYDELISAEEVESRNADDITGSDGTWSPTTYIDLEFIHDERYPQFECTGDDVTRIKEQIRTVKPINVVFHDVIEKYVGYISCNPSITMGPIRETGSLGAVQVKVTGTGSEKAGIQTELDVDYGPTGNGVTNCMF